MNDRYERECDRKEEIRQTEINATTLAEKLRILFPKYKEFQKIASRLSAAGYRIDKDGDKVKIWKQI